MTRQLDRQTLVGVLERETIDALSFGELTRLFREETETHQFLPDGVYQVDPRNGDVILYHSSRARRPHDNRPSLTGPLGVRRECAICQGRTTGVIDVADLSEGFTFINKNLFPVLYPFEVAHSTPPNSGEGDPGAAGGAAYGFHFLQWTSSHHDKDWHNMPLGDCRVVMSRLAALEEKLITESGEFMPATAGQERGFVLIVKNYGYLVGGSLSHGHQQIAFSNVMPRHMQDNRRFEIERGESFSAYLLRESPPDLAVKDYGPAILLVPYFMRRPFDMMLLLKDSGKRHLYELTDVEMAAVAEGWHDAIRAIHVIMPELGREIAFNVITNNGPSAGIYFEFLPYTQEMGGAEHLGLLVCQQNPKNVADHIRQVVGGE